MKNNHLAETNICEVVEIVWKQFWKHLHWHEFSKVSPSSFQQKQIKLECSSSSFPVSLLHQNTTSHTHSWMENILWSVKSPKIRIKRIHNCALKWELTSYMNICCLKMKSLIFIHRAQQYHPAFTTHNVCGVMEAALKANIVNCPTNG